MREPGKHPDSPRGSIGLGEPSAAPGFLFDWWDATGPVNVLVIPEFLWELLLGIYAAVWGFRASSPILRGEQGTVVQTT